MKAILGLATLAVVLMAASARAEDAPAGCEVPAYLLSSDSSLSRVAETVRNGRKLEILVVGGGSCGVQRSHRPEAEPLSYNIIELARRGNEAV